MAVQPLAFHLTKTNNTCGTLEEKQGYTYVYRDALILADVQELTYFSFVRELM